MKKIVPPSCLLKPISLMLVLMTLLAGCATQRPENVVKVYDFGLAPLSAVVNGPPTGLATVALFEAQVSPVLEGNAVLYRLVYADPQQLKPYALTRWSMPPAQLISQRLRQQLGLQRAVVVPGEAAAQLSLRLVLEEFSQVFDSPAQSHALVRLRATLTQRASGGETLLAQQSFVVKQPASTPDAVGAVRALTAASDQAVVQVSEWLAPWGRP
ncbi:MAG: hypothetical protein RLZZ371_2194 [Pseudomonadota bacterium]|jgi:cholesterol transport system auxiliary component